MKRELAKIGICDKTFELVEVRQLVAQRIIEKPLDGNHGELHPKGEDFVELGVPFIMASDIKDGHVDYTSCKFITAKQADSLRKGFARNGDVLVTHKATIGRTAIVNYSGHPYIMLSPQVTYYRVKDRNRLNNRYLRYYFDSELFQKTLQLWADAGATRAYLGITAQVKLPVIVPPIEKQKKIAAILSSYDELIENNKRRIALLEKMAGEIYREWFVRQRFPSYQNARLERGLPSNWELCKIGRRFSTCLGGTPSRGEPLFWDGTIPWINSGEVNKPRIINGSEFITQRGLSSSAATMMPKRTTVIAITGATLGQVSLTEIEVCANQSVVGVFDPAGVYNEYIFQFIKSNIEKMVTKQSGGGQQHINKDVVDKENMLVPPEDLISRYNKVIRPLFDSVRVLLISNRTLSASRDFLLPRLMGGKLSVEDLDIQLPPSMADELTSGPIANLHA